MIRKGLAVFIIYTLITSPAGYGADGSGFDKEAYIKGAVNNRTVNITMKDCVFMALKNNNEISIKKVVPLIQDENVRQQKAVFDPVLSSYIEINDNTDTSNMSALTGSTTSKTRTGIFNFGLDEKLTSGALVSLDYLNTRTRSNSAIQNVNPSYDSEALLTVTQPLARGAGEFVNKANIYIAKNNKLMAEKDFLSTVIDVLTNVKKLYYAFQYTQARHYTAEASLNRVKSLHLINSERYKKGLASDVDLLQSEAETALYEQVLYSSEESLLLSEDALKFATNIVNDAEFWNAKLITTDELKYEQNKPDILGAINIAFKQRPDYEAAKLDIKNKDINVKFTHNGLYPQIDLFGSFGLNGLNNDYGKSWANISSGKYKEWSYGVNVSVPFGNDDAKAKYGKAMLEKQQALIGFKRLEQKIILEVRNAVRNAEINYKIVESSLTSKLAQEKQYSSQVERFKQGLVSTHDMLDFQEKLSMAQDTYVKSVVEYNVTLLELARVEGVTLINDNIEIDKGVL